LNLPNSITLGRIACVPLFLWILSGAGARMLAGRQEMAAAAVLLIAWGSGALDGYLARRRKQVTTLGVLLSALTHRLLVTAAFVALVHFAPALVPAWIAVLIVAREFLVTGLRAVAVQEHMKLDVPDLGRAMPVLQTISVLCLLMAHARPRWQLPGLHLSSTEVAQDVLWLMLGFAIFSALAYLHAFLQEARERQ
jgi:CDP-diacylglycerol--glycerol-3-phosphate 3-phosphatidyltransferase